MRDAPNLFSGLTRNSAATRQRVQGKRGGPAIQLIDPTRQQAIKHHECRRCHPDLGEVIEERIQEQRLLPNLVEDREWREARPLRIRRIVARRVAVETSMGILERPRHGLCDLDPTLLVDHEPDLPQQTQGRATRNATSVPSVCTTWASRIPAGSQNVE